MDKKILALTLLNAQPYAELMKIIWDLVLVDAALRYRFALSLSKNLGNNRLTLLAAAKCLAICEPLSAAANH